MDDVLTTVEARRRRFTVAEYYRMAEVGILGPEERVELIEGEIIQMSPIGTRHAGCVINLTRLLVTRLGNRAVVSPQNPVVIRPRSEPQPDMLVLRPRSVSYSRAHPAPEDVLLAIEVADTTTRFDGIVKAGLYARAQIGEYWLVDVNAERVDLFRAPGAEAYADTSRVGRGGRVAALAFPDVVIAIDALFA